MFDKMEQELTTLILVSSKYSYFSFLCWTLILGEMQDIVTSCGYEIISNQYVLRETVNKKENVHVPRVFLQGKFVKR